MSRCDLPMWRVASTWSLVYSRERRQLALTLLSVLIFTQLGDREQTKPHRQDVLVLAFSNGGRVYLP